MDTLFSEFLGVFVYKDAAFTANVWGDGNVPIHTTTRQDAAKYLAEVILDPEIPNKAIVSVAGDTQTFNDIVQIIQSAGLKVEVKNHGSLDDMKAEIHRRYQANPQNFFSCIT